MGDQGRTQALAALAARQWGVVSTRQLGGLGFSKKLVAEEAKRGRLQRLHRGVYAVGHDRLTWHGRCMAAVLGAEPLDDPPALASHWAAAYIWGLVLREPTIHVTVDTRRRAKRPFTVHFARLAPEDRAIHDGMPVTALPRTLLDQAAARPTRIGHYLKRSEELGLFDLFALDDLLARVGGHPGRGHLQSALDIYRPDPELTRSGIERLFRDLVREAGLPRPAMNFNVAGFELDAYWPELRFCVELDVFETHGTRASFETDRRRQEELKLIGVEMVRFTGPRLRREPNAIGERLATLLRLRREEIRP